MSFGMIKRESNIERIEEGRRGMTMEKVQKEKIWTRIKSGRWRTFFEFGRSELCVSVWSTFSCTHTGTGMQGCILMIQIIFHFSFQCSVFFRKHSPCSLTSSSSFLLFSFHMLAIVPPHNQFWSFDTFVFTKGYKVHIWGHFLKHKGIKKTKKQKKRNMFESFVLHFRKWSVDGWVESHGLGEEAAL